MEGYIAYGVGALHVHVASAGADNFSVLINTCGPFAVGALNVGDDVLTISDQGRSIRSGAGVCVVATFGQPLKRHANGCQCAEVETTILDCLPWICRIAGIDLIRFAPGFVGNVGGTDG